jgi:hypothetical protein
MFYKFVGGDDAALLDIFDKAVVGGSLKFSSALSFNDPFEFKFVSRAPTRAEFDAWHATYAPHRTPDELANAWASFSGTAADWNTRLRPRMNVLEQSYVMCLAKCWDSHLMWGHYSSAHHGFAIRYRSQLIDALRSLGDFWDAGPVTYSDGVPELRWFTAPPAELSRPILFTKSREWRHEGEYRVILGGCTGKEALYRSVDPSLIEGIIFGTRTPPALIDKALALQTVRPEFTVEQVTSAIDSYGIATTGVVAGVRAMTGML